MFAWYLVGRISPFPSHELAKNSLKNIISFGEICNHNAAGGSTCAKLLAYVTWLFFNQKDRNWNVACCIVEFWRRTNAFVFWRGIINTFFFILKCAPISLRLSSGKLNKKTGNAFFDQPGRNEAYFFWVFTNIVQWAISEFAHAGDWSIYGPITLWAYGPIFQRKLR